ncbi:MAG: LacI family transcriptional regulator [Alphaproteobacteria bacterium]|nr:LacI family transcriptional regulator [Alphaproteobacteria bacterium]
MNGKPRPPRLADIARLAEVSIATVSKAINGKDRVSQATRRRVILAAEQLAYPLADEGPGAATPGGTVGLLTSDLEGRFSLPILKGAEDTFGSGSVSVFLCNARGDAIRERHYVSALLGRKVDAIMVVGSRTDARLPVGQNLPVPVIYVYTPSSDPADCSLTTDNVEAGRLATQHLLDIGRRRIAYITGPHQQQAARDRARGVAEVMQRAGLALEVVTPQGEWSEHWGRIACANMLDRGYQIDAVLCDSDQIARGALDTFRERGIAVPRDVAVIGFDNWDTIVDGTHPKLTSLDMQLDNMGRLAAQMLNAAIKGEPLQPGVMYQHCNVVVRGSTLISI